MWKEEEEVLGGRAGGARLYIIWLWPDGLFILPAFIPVAGDRISSSMAGLTYLLPHALKSDDRGGVMICSENCCSMYVMSGKYQADVAFMSMETGFLL